LSTKIESILIILCCKYLFYNNKLLNNEDGVYIGLIALLYRYFMLLLPGNLSTT